MIALKIYAKVHSMQSMTKAEQEDLVESMYQGMNGEIQKVKVSMDEM